MDADFTVFCGNLANEVCEELLYELFLQVAPVKDVRIPSDSMGRKCSFGFVSFIHQCSVPYAVKLLDGIEVYGRYMSVKPKKKPIPQPKNLPPIDTPNERYLPYSPAGNSYQFNNFNDQMGYPLQALNAIPSLVNFTDLMHPSLMVPPSLYESPNHHRETNCNYAMDNNVKRSNSRNDYRHGNNYRDLNNSKKRKRNPKKSSREMYDKRDNDEQNDSFAIRSRLDQLGSKRKHRKKREH